jgi:tetratricopeptide (TPR) repeat protein
LDPPAAGTHPESLADREQALAWLTAEHNVLLATVRHATAAGFELYTCQLAWALRQFLVRVGRWRDLLTIGHAVRHAGQRMGEPTVEAFALRMSARAEVRLGRFPQARSDLERALELYERAGHQVGVGHTYNDLNQMCQRQGEHAQAVEYATRSLAIFRAIGHHLSGLGAALNTLGYSTALVGEHSAALEYCKQALAVNQQLGDTSAEALTWHSLGYAYHGAGQHAEAANCYQQALRLLRAPGERYNPSIVLAHLGDAYHAAGDRAAAREAWRAALTILEDLRHPDADAVRAKLERAS